MEVKIFAVLVQDRHADPEIKLFGPSKILEAVEYARTTALGMARGDESDMQVYLNSAMERAGWLWFASVGPEGDSVRVQALGVQ